MAPIARGGLNIVDFKPSVQVSICRVSLGIERDSAHANGTF